MNLEDRIELFKNMAAADPENELAHFSLGKLYRESGAWAEAEKSLRRSLEINPHHAVAHQLLGEVLLAQGKREEAIGLLEHGVRLAHERGEFMPRDRMRRLLEAEGVAPPDLTRRAGGEAGPVDPHAFVCKRCYRANPPLAQTPFSGELGEKVLASICTSCWREWLAMSIKVINEYRLNMASPEANETYENHLREFLGL
jgi:Fe-S cluster biosynthesis and repair protein YggX